MFAFCPVPGACGALQPSLSNKGTAWIRRCANQQFVCIIFFNVLQSLPQHFNFASMLFRGFIICNTDSQDASGISGRFAKLSFKL